jgi:hypothetical protein
MLDSSKEDEKVAITLYDLTDDKVADSKEFGIAYSLASGENTSFCRITRWIIPRMSSMTQRATPPRTIGWRLRFSTPIRESNEKRADCERNPYCERKRCCLDGKANFEQRRMA